VTGDELVRILAWLGLGVWLGTLVLFFKRRVRAAAVIQSFVALPFAVAAAITLVKWLVDPVAYTRQHGTAALHELPGDAAILGLSLLILLTCGLALRGRRSWLMIPFFLNGVGLVYLFYFAYFFRIF
jgi:hypothetical protein